MIHSVPGIRGRGHVTFNQLVTETALHPKDIALAFMLLGKKIALQNITGT